MILSIRVSTVAACLLGISVGTYIGAMGAVYVADKWPQNKYFEPRAAFPAPNPLRFGRVASGDSVLCDKDNRAWSLASYDSNEYGISRMWRGIQELDIVEVPRSHDKQEHVDENGVSMPVAYKVEQQKCI